MPIVNVGTARNLFDALKQSLSNNGLDFNKCIAFMSDTTNVAERFKLFHLESTVYDGSVEGRPAFGALLANGTEDAPDGTDADKLTRERIRLWQILY